MGVWRPENHAGLPIHAWVWAGSCKRRGIGGMTYRLWLSGRAHTWVGAAEETALSDIFSGNGSRARADSSHRRLRSSAKQDAPAWERWGVFNL